MSSHPPPKRQSSWPWSRRQRKWDPPTPLDSFVESPIKYFITIVYHILLYLRGPPFKPPRNKPAVRIVCISDTHSNTLPVPHGDVLIHAGDLTNSGLAADIQAQIDWIAGLPHREKIIIAGNHDNYFDTKSRKAEDRTKSLNFKGVHYLVNKSLTLKFKGGRKLNFYGCPGIPQLGGNEHAFQYTTEDSYWTNRIPPSTDVLITHTPPAHHLDISLGCPSLLNAIWATKPRLHVFGHVHSGHGREAVYWDPAQAAYERLCSNTTRWTGLVPSWDLVSTWVDVVKVVFYGVRGILWDRLMVGPGGGNGGLLVNAAVVWRSTVDVGNRPQIVEL